MWRAREENTNARVWLFCVARPVGAFADAVGHCARAADALINYRIIVKCARERKRRREKGAQKKGRTLKSHLSSLSLLRHTKQREETNSPMSKSFLLTLIYIYILQSFSRAMKKMY